MPFKTITKCVLMLSILLLAGCSLGSSKKVATLTPEGTPTVQNLAPELTQVLPPTPTQDLAPTPLPPPTQIPPPTLLPSNGQPGGAGPGISIKPAVGEPRDIVVVTGTGWPPNVQVTLHWGPVKGPTGPVYWEVTTDNNGSFSVGLIVLPRERWPGGFPMQGDILQLRALSPALPGVVYWANFTLIMRPTPVVIVARTPTATMTCINCW